MIQAAEQDAARVATTHTVKLKARALPFATFRTQVDRIAPAADPGEAQSTLTVYVQLEGSPAALRPGMTGHARITTGHRPIGRILLDRTLRFLRTEFWW